MARDITTGFKTEITAQSLSPCILVKAEFDGGDVNIWTGYGSITYNGDTYSGVGNLIGISPIQETQNLEANNVNFSLSGIPSSFVSTALTEDFQGRPITAWFGVLDSAGALIASPYKIFSGQMDTMEIYDDGRDSTITVRGESDLIDLRESRERRYTAEDQKIEFSGDKGFDFVSSIEDIEITWGST